MAEDPVQALADEVTKLMQDMMRTSVVHRIHVERGELQRAELARRQLELQARTLRATLNVAQVELWQAGEIPGDFPEPIPDEDMVKVAIQILTVMNKLEKKK